MKYCSPFHLSTGNGVMFHLLLMLFCRTSKGSVMKYGMPYVVVLMFSG
jgi:hypothetical protein